MGTYQLQALWELCRQGYPISADEAELRWRSGEVYRPDPQMRVPRALQALIELCNHEVSPDRDHWL